MGPRTILVTGGSRGIGRCLVERLVTAGSQVAFTWNHGEAEAREIEAGSGGLAFAYRLDLRDRERPGDLAREIEAQLGPIAGLVNNAGIRKDALLAALPDEDWDDVLDVNLGGAFRCCRAVLPGMIARRHGVIVNVASLTAIRGVVGQAAYAAAKAGLLGMTRVLAREMGRRNIRVNAVVPGFVPTDMTATAPAESIAVLRSTECLPSGVLPGSVADAVQFLLSDRAAAITGQTIVVDAGSSA